MPLATAPKAWKFAVERREGPTALALSRQNLPIMDQSALGSAEEGVPRGAYILWESVENNGGQPQVIIIATGSEVPIALEAGQTLKEQGISARIVSMPSCELFDAQPEEYRHRVLPPQIRARVSIEAGTPLGWERYVGLDGTAIGVPHFGASAPAEVLYEKFDLTSQRVVAEATQLIQRGVK